MGETTKRRQSKKPSGKSSLQPKARISDQDIYSLEFDGASKGNPGKAGAGAILKAPDGTVVCQLAKGVGIATCNFAEYQALIMGLKAALERDICYIKAQGDSQLVCMQMMGSYKVRSPNILRSFSEAMKLKKRFQSFSMQHVQRELNAAADYLANYAVGLPVDQLQCECSMAVDGKEIPSKYKDISGCSTNVSSFSPERKEVFCINYHGTANRKYAGAGVVLYSPDGTLRSKISQELDIATHNVAHYQALLIALRTAQEYKASYIQIKGDSVLVFKQMTGALKVNDERLQTLWKEANALLSSFSDFSITHVDKAQNSVACTLAEMALGSPGYMNKTDDAKSVGTSGTEMGNVRCGGSLRIQTRDTRNKVLHKAGSEVETSIQNLSKAALLFHIPTQSSALFRSHSHQLSRLSRGQASQPLLKCLPLYMAKTSAHKSVLQCPSKTAKIIPCIFHCSIMHIRSGWALHRPAFVSPIWQTCLKRTV